MGAQKGDPQKEAQEGVGDEIRRLCARDGAVASDTRYWNRASEAAGIEETDMVRSCVAVDTFGMPAQPHPAVVPGFAAVRGQAHRNRSCP